MIFSAPVAQWIERPPPKGKVARSIRARGTSHFVLFLSRRLNRNGLSLSLAVKVLTSLFSARIISNGPLQVLSETLPVSPEMSYILGEG